MAGYISSLSIFSLTFYFIISGKLDRTVASFIGAMAMVVAGKLCGFYSQEEAFHSIDFNMIGLLLGMMIIVSVCKKTGFFSYIAVRAAKASNGSTLRLMVMMGCVTAFLSMFLDNVTTIILTIPITVLICDIIGISPLPVVLTEIVLSNIGGVGTMIGDPPNMMIASASEFSFDDFIIHLFPIVMVAIVLGIIVLAFLFRKETKVVPQNFHSVLNINEKAAIKDEKGLRRVVFSLAIVVGLFILQKRHGFHHSFIALIGAGIVLLLVRPDLEDIMRDVEWPILAFFASLFVLVGGLEKAGFLSMIAGKIGMIARVNYNLAKISILWVSAIFASLVDRIPFTTAMIPIIKEVGELGFNVDSLWWVLALGVGFGGNGTPIGSIVGVVGLAMSEKTNSPIDYKTWIKTATVVMLVTIIFVTLLIKII
ncbi:MAG: ArsB/NhaD family transporter [Candidatus Omnitrophica bacterium]|nr:ArsB/NhaD family transporter [Candidatus Omnitrophota bacterium]